MAQLSIETVKQVIDTLKNQGKKPTNRNIVNYLGYGSFSTLKKIREHHPEIFSDTIIVSDTHQKVSSSQINSVLEKRVSSLEALIHSMQQSIQELIQDKKISELQKQIEELTEDLKEMYQLWREQLGSLPPEEIIPTKITTTPVEVFHELPNPKNEAFIPWAEQQKEQYDGSWKPAVEWLNQHQVFMLKGQSWNAKSLSDFIRKKRQKLKQQNFSERS